MTIAWGAYRTKLDPAFAGMVDAALGPLATRYIITQGYRSTAEQNALFAKGRNAQGVVISAKDTVTNARGGQSAHNYGCAVDFVPADDTAYANVNLKSWQDAIRAVQANPLLLSGATFTIASGAKDYGHIELRDWRSRRTVSDVTATQPTSTTDGGGASSAPGSESSRGSAATLFFVDPGVAVAVAAIVGLLGVWYWKGGR